MKFFTKIKSYIFSHKIISIIALVVIVFGGRFIYAKITSTTGETRYVLGATAKGTIISSVTGTGQVSAFNQIDLKPNVSGTITYVGVTPGNQIGVGKLLFSIDDTNAQKAVRDAEVGLQSAQIALDKSSVQNSNENLNSTLSKAHDNGFSTISNTFLDLPGIMAGLNDMFFKSTISISNGQWNIDWFEAQVSSQDTDNVKIYKQNFIDSYKTALAAYNDDFNNYKSISRTSNNATIEKLITQTYDTVKLISSAIKDASNYLDFVTASIQKVQNAVVPSSITAQKTILNDFTGKTNTPLLNLLSIETEIKSDKDAFINTDLDTKSLQLSLQQKKNALQDAKDNLAFYAIRSPFSGTVASVPVQKGDNVGSGTTLATIITREQIATISLNEVDIAKIQLGQKSTLTFDAVPDLTITGKVVQIDSVGTVSQGVVNYNVKISFDTNDPRIKPGMSVNAAVIIGIKQDVLTVPNGAIKNSNGSAYVEMFDAPLPAPLPGIQGSPSVVPPRQETVVIGASNDTSTEIISGLNDGDKIVVRTILPTAASATAPSLFGSTTNRGGGGAVRIPGR